MVEPTAHNGLVGGSSPSSSTSFGPLAQSVEHRTLNPQVVGSNPTGSTSFGHLAQ